ncbi:hypothetical protein HZS_3345, partial [Henneguya salminicola]
MPFSSLPPIHSDSSDIKKYPKKSVQPVVRSDFITRNNSNYDDNSGGLSKNIHTSVYCNKLNNPINQIHTCDSFENFKSLKHFFTPMNNPSGSNISCFLYFLSDLGFSNFRTVRYSEDINTPLSKGIPSSVNNFDTDLNFMPSFEQIGGGEFGINIPPVQTTTTIHPSFGIHIQPGENIAMVVNENVDKEIQLFGYKNNSLRFGNLDYYNSNYSSYLNTNIATEKSIEIVAQANITPSMIETYSYTNFNHDIALSKYENPNKYFSLVNPPLDSVTKLRFSKFHGNILAVASWDGTVRLWKISPQTNNMIFYYSLNVKGCILDLEWTKEGRLILAHSDGTISLLDITSRTAEVIGKHNGPVKSVTECSVGNSNLILSGSYDGSVKIWDARSKTYVYVHNANGKVYGIEFKNGSFAFINSIGELYIYTLSNPPILRSRRELNNKYPLRSLTIDNYNTTQASDIVAAVGTTNGRVFLVSLSKNLSDISFKSNRQLSSLKINTQVAYPIHDLVFHPTSKTLACGGGDGVVAVWDIQNKNPVYTSKQDILPITSIGYNQEGSLMACAVGYDWSRVMNYYDHKGIQAYKYNAMKTKIYIRHCNEELNCQPPIMIYRE